MSATTKVYRVDCYDYMMRINYFATKGEAAAFSRQWLKEAKADDYPDATCEVEAVTVPLNAAGIADALNHLLSSTCHNEG